MLTGALALLLVHLYFFLSGSDPAFFAYPALFPSDVETSGNFISANDDKHAYGTVVL